MNWPQNRHASYSTPVIYGLLALAIYASWMAGNAINWHLAQLPVREWQQVSAKPSAINGKSLYPIWAKVALAAKDGVPSNAHTVQNDYHAPGNLDALFKKKEDKAPIELAKVPAPAPAMPIMPAIAEIDYVSAVKQLARLQSVADNGAVINGRFYAKGETISALAVMRSGKEPLLPVLALVQGSSVSIKVGNKSVKLELRPAY